jgi:hypothetical protein
MTQIPVSASPEIERLQVRIRRYEEAIRLLELELSETQRLVGQAVGRLATILDRYRRRPLL